MQIPAIPLRGGQTTGVLRVGNTVRRLTNGRFCRGRTKEDLKHNGLRALVFGDEPDGSRVIYDCAVTAKDS